MALGAVIMAGGEGVRLRPMTLDLPKPLMPLLGKPVVSYALELLKRHGVGEAAATLCYLPGAIKQALGHEAAGVKLTYFEEKLPLGTAGSVKWAARQAQDTFFVLSGDGLTDADLTKALAEHKKNGALATLILKRVSVPLPYGVVMTNESGRITHFIEKPTWSRVFSDLVNTGIYILSKELLGEIPDDGQPDFGRDVFPALLKRGAPLYGYEMDGYWCDIGSQSAFLGAQRDLMEGRVNLPLPERLCGDADISKDAQVDEFSFVLKGARVEPGARIEHSVIGEGALVGARAFVTDSCLMARASVCAGATAVSSVLCAGARLNHDARALQGSALGAGAVVGRLSQVMPGVSVWPRLTVPEMTDADADITRQGAPCVACVPGGLILATPSMACRTGASLSENARQILLCGAKDEPLLSVLQGTLTAYGTEVWLLHAPKTVCAALAREFQRQAVFVAGETVSLYDEKGLPLSDKALAKLSEKAKRDAPPPLLMHGKTVVLSGAERTYLSLLPKASRGGINVVSQEEDVRALIAKAFTPSGRDEAVLLYDGGTKYALVQGQKRLPAETTAMLCAALVQQGGVVHAQELPAAAALKWNVLPYDDSELSLRQWTAFHDGFAFARLLAQALEASTLSELLARLPVSFTARREISCPPDEKGRVLHRLSLGEPGFSLGEGLTLHNKDYDVNIRPDNLRAAVHVTVEAAKYEIADELCARFEQKVRGNP